MSKEFEQFTITHGIEHQHTVHATPQQNGVAEQANQTAKEAITTMLAEAKLPPSFWGEAPATYVHIWNRCPTCSLASVTPFEAWFGKKTLHRIPSRMGMHCLCSCSKKINKGILNHTLKSVSFLDILPG